MLGMVQSDHTATTIGLRKKVLVEEEQWLWWYTLNLCSGVDIEGPEVKSSLAIEQVGNQPRLP